MNTIVNEELVSFKDLEQKIFNYVCELAREITQSVLEAYDKELADSRDTKLYRGKGKHQTSIKTVYGTVEYTRNVYRTENEDGQAEYIYLLDQAMHAYTLTFDDSPERALHIFANALESDIPDFNNQNVIYVGPGEWDIQSISLESGQTLYVAGGAVIHGMPYVCASARMRSGAREHRPFPYSILRTARPDRNWCRRPPMSLIRREAMKWY